jgi:hypothetical protein
MSEHQDGFLDHDPADEDYGEADAELLNLLDEVQQDVKGWLPQPGATVYGVVTDMGIVTGGDYNDYQLVTIKTPSGKLVNVHCFHTVLDREITRKRESGKLVEGSRIAIKYLGEGEAKNGQNAPHMYRVAIRPPVAVTSDNA